MTREETALALSALKREWRETEVDAERIELWHRALVDLPYPAVEAAVLWWVAEEKWCPRPGELRERAERLIDGIIRHDSYPARVGLQAAVHVALLSGEPLAIGG